MNMLTVSPSLVDISTEEQDEDIDSDEEEIGEKCIQLLSSLLPSGSLTHLGFDIELEESSSTEIVEKSIDIPPCEKTIKIIDQQNEILEEDHLDEMASSSHVDVQMRPRPPTVPPKPTMDTVRYSMNNIKESTDWQLDALLEELSALETQLNSSTGDQLLLGIPSIAAKSTENNNQELYASIKKPTPSCVAEPPRSSEVTSVVSQTSRVPFQSQSITSFQQQVTASTATAAPSAVSSCSSPDRDSAYGDSTSSTESRNRNSAFSSNDSCRDSLNTPSPTQISPRNPEPTADELKAAKIKQALEKMKEAKVTRIFVKFFVDDGAPLQMLVDERWTVADTMIQLAEKNQIQLMEDHCIVEEYPELYIKRIYEDHENLVENIQMWLQDSPNKLYFVRRPDKYSFIDRPDIYLVTEKTMDLEVPQEATWSREQKQQFVQDFFNRDTVSPPEMEGFLYLKSDGRKSWKKHFFVLRSSGLYYSPKGKKTVSSKDLQCLMNINSNQVYTGVNWSKKYKSPTEHCIAIKLTQLQVKRSQYIKYICAEDETTMKKWMVALRIAKNGGSLLNSFEKACDRRRTELGEMASCSSSQRANSRMSNATTHESIRQPISVSTQQLHNSQQDIRSNKTHSMASPSQLSRISHVTTVSEQSAAESIVLEYDEQPTGTIKRAPHDVIRRMSQSSSGGAGRSTGTPEDEDSDEDFPAPPPVISASRTNTPSQMPCPPPKPVFNPPSGAAKIGPHTAVRTSVPPVIQEAPTTPKKVPPPPPKRSDATRVQTGLPGGSPHMSDLEVALARRREKMGSTAV